MLTSSFYHPSSLWRCAYSYRPPLMQCGGGGESAHTGSSERRNKHHCCGVLLFFLAAALATLNLIPHPCSHGYIAGHTPISQFTRLIWVH